MWKEIESGVIGPRSLTLGSLAKRIAAVGDLWEGMAADRRSLAPALAALKEVAPS